VTDKEPEDISSKPSSKLLSPAAQRALAEAEQRRLARQAEAMPKEIGGANGPEPTRFGDWEKNGIVSDF